jgi:hypothetical protein
MLCDGCSDRRATRCPFCGSTFGREVKRTSRCKKCGEAVARHRESPDLATQLATPTICEALKQIDLEDPEVDQDWLRECLVASLLDASRAGTTPRLLETAFATALRVQFESGLTQKRLRDLGLGFARAIWLCGGNPRPIQRSLHRDYLESILREEEFIAVYAAHDSCDKCRLLRGKVYRVNEALILNPLPCRECLHINAGGFGWCRCTFENPAAEAERRRIMQDWAQSNPDMVSSDCDGATKIRKEWGLPARRESP